MSGSPLSSMTFWTPGAEVKEDRSNVKVFDFFSGCGGASCGFRAAGMDVVFALDRDADARRTFKLNFRTADFECADIRETPLHRIRELSEAQKPAPILFSGCAPCQPFTKQNTTRPASDADDRVTLLESFALIVEHCKPDVVFVENVPGIQRLSRRSQPFGGFLERLEAAGYHHPVACRPVALMRYGVPQTRRRLVLLASRHGPIGLPTETHGPGTPIQQYATVRDWIEDLPRISVGETHPEVPNHRAARLSELNLQRIRATPEGGGHQNWPEPLRLPCHVKANGYSDVYGRLSWDRPAAALTTRCISYSNGRFGHPQQNRAISVREAACLQTFPRDFVFTGSLGSMARQIGNAVPVLMAKVVGAHVNRHLEEAGALR